MQPLQSRNTREGKLKVQGGSRLRWSFSAPKRTKRKYYVMQGWFASARRRPGATRKVTHKSWRLG